MISNSFEFPYCSTILQFKFSVHLALLAILTANMIDFRQTVLSHPDASAKHIPVFKKAVTRLCCNACLWCKSSLSIYRDLLILFRSLWKNTTAIQKYTLLPRPVVLLLIEKPINIQTYISRIILQEVGCIKPTTSASRALCLFTSVRFTLFRRQRFFCRRLRTSTVHISYTITTEIIVSYLKADQ